MRKPVTEILTSLYHVWGPFFNFFFIYINGYLYPPRVLETSAVHKLAAANPHLVWSQHHSHEHIFFIFYCFSQERVKRWNVLSLIIVSVSAPVGLCASPRNSEWKGTAFWAHWESLLRQHNIRRIWHCDMINISKIKSLCPESLWALWSW